MTDLVDTRFANPGRGSRLRRRRGPRPDRRIRVGRPLRVAATVFAVVAGLLLAGAGTGRTFFFDDDQDVPPFRIDEQFRRRLRELADRPGGRNAAEAPAWLDYALYLLALVVVVAFVAAVLYGLYVGLRQLHRYLAQLADAPWRPEAYEPFESTDDDAEGEVKKRLRRQFEAGAFDIGDAAEAREAVVACYQRMERAVAAAGTPRQPHETPEELLSRVLAAHDVPRPSVERLTALYEEARYSRHVVDNDMRAAARRCLDDVRAAVGA